jgi:hypothetical protein
MSNQVLLMDNRQLIPRWHTSRKGMSLQFPTLSKTSVDPEGFIDDESLVEARDAWNEEQNYFNAMELYTALLVKSLFNDSDFDDTLNFLLSMGNALPKGAYDLIAPDNKYIDKELKYYTYAPDRVHKIIARLRSIVRKFPHDYMTWNDIAFYYTVLGLDKKAAESIEIAWLLCDGHPYIARGYSRFLVHKGEPEKAIWILKKSGGLYHDPLITSAGLAIGNAFEIPSVDVVKSRSLLQHFNGFKPFTSELSATLGTLEFNNGRKKKAKDFFSRALELPSENALSQYKWLNSKYGFSIDESASAKILTPEGNANSLYVDGKFQECRDKLLELFSFQPISDGPIADAGYMSIVGLNDPDFVISLSENRVPKTHMSFGELNNLIVAKLMKNDLASAEVDSRLLAQKVHKGKVASKGIFLATSGFVMFKLGEIQAGKDLYNKAIKYFESIRQPRSVALAEYFLSENLRLVSDADYPRLREKVSSKAKSLNMKELELKKEG